MDTQTRDRLLALNRHFYTTVAAPFHATRQVWTPGKRRLLTLMPCPADRPLRVLDVGCGNGRFARMLETLDRGVDYTGVDADAALLRFAGESTRDLRGVMSRLILADLADPNWVTLLGDLSPWYDVVLCLATLQHLPGEELRGRVMGELAACVASGGLVIVSAWQFLSAERFACKQIAWQTVGVDPAQVETGDALLPWQQEHYAVRYVHQIDQSELARLAVGAGLTVVEWFWADGREGNLNLYAILQRKASNQA